MKKIKFFKKKFIVMENEEAKRFVFNRGRDYDNIIRLIAIAKTLEGDLRDEMLNVISDQCKANSNELTATLEKLF